MRKLTRRAAIGAGAAVAAAGAFWWARTRKPPLGMSLAPAALEQAAALMDRLPVVDVHSHPGRFFLTGAHPESLVIRLMRDGYEEDRIADMRHAGVTASVFSIVSDLQVLGLEGGGLSVVRQFRPGEAHEDFQRQLARLQYDIDRGLVSAALTPDDVRLAKRDDRTVAILASEGGDFIEGDLDRLADAYARGLRSVTLLHYNTNALGDNQTNTAGYGGLTDTGRGVVAEMNRLGMIIDVAHASADTCADIVAASVAPVMLSHSNLNSTAVQSPRFISVHQARKVADAGGLIGAWPAGIGSTSLADFIRQVMALVDAVGAEHVAIGSDMDGNYKPVLTEYADFPLVAAALLQEGMDETAVGRVLGGNFLRVFDDVVSASEPRPGAK